MKHFEDKALGSTPYKREAVPKKPSFSALHLHSLVSHLMHFVCHWANEVGWGALHSSGLEEGALEASCALGLQDLQVLVHQSWIQYPLSDHQPQAESQISSLVLWPSDFASSVSVSSLPLASGTMNTADFPWGRGTRSFHTTLPVQQCREHTTK